MRTVPINSGPAGGGGGGKVTPVPASPPHPIKSMAAKAHHTTTKRILASHCPILVFFPITTAFIWLTSESCVGQQENYVRPNPAVRPTAPRFVKRYRTATGFAPTLPGDGARCHAASGTRLTVDRRFTAYRPLVP
jgi:hypothetical protein